MNDLAQQRLARLRALPQDHPIRSHQISRLLAVGVWRSGQVHEWLLANCSYLEEPRHVGDILGLRGCFRLGDVVEALAATVPDFLTGEAWTQLHQYQQAQVAAPTG